MNFQPEPEFDENKTVNSFLMINWGSEIEINKKVLDPDIADDKKFLL